MCGRPRGEPGDGAVAQLGERVLCKHEVAGSIPVGSTIRSEPRSGQNRPVDGFERRIPRSVDRGWCGPRERKDPQNKAGLVKD